MGVREREHQQRDDADEGGLGQQHHQHLQPFAAGGVHDEEEDVGELDDQA